MVGDHFKQTLKFPFNIISLCSGMSNKILKQIWIYSKIGLRNILIFWGSHFFSPGFIQIQNEERKLCGVKWKLYQSKWIYKLIHACVDLHVVIHYALHTVVV